MKEWTSNCSGRCACSLTAGRSISGARATVRWWRGSPSTRDGPSRPRHSSTTCGAMRCLRMRRTRSSRSSPALGGAYRLRLSPRRRPVTSCMPRTSTPSRPSGWSLTVITRLRCRCGAVTPWPGLDGVPFVPQTIARLEELRLGALETTMTERVRAGADAVLVSELADLTAAHPYREGLWHAYLEALVGTGNQAEALAAFERLRSRLADDLGADPSPALQELHLTILRGETVSTFPVHRTVAGGTHDVRRTGRGDHRDRQGARGEPAGDHRRARWRRQDAARDRDRAGVRIRRRLARRARTGHRQCGCHTDDPVGGRAGRAHRHRPSFIRSAH